MTTEKHRYQPADWSDNPDCKICGQKRTDSRLFMGMLISKVHKFDNRDTVPLVNSWADLVNSWPDDDDDD